MLQLCQVKDLPKEMSMEDMLENCTGELEMVSNSTYMIDMTKRKNRIT